VAKGTLYLYFRSKEDVYSSILLEDTRRLNALTHERIDEVDSWDEKVAAYAQVRFEYLEKETDFVRIYLGEIRSSMIRGAKQDCAFYEAVRESEAILAQVFVAAAARGEIRPVDPRRAAAVAVDLIRGVMERQLLGWGTPKDGEFALDILCRSLAVR
jgi:AcrR family transcriptional regulator